MIDIFKNAVQMSCFHNSTVKDMVADEYNFIIIMKY